MLLNLCVYLTGLWMHIKCIRSGGLSVMDHIDIRKKEFVGHQQNLRISKFFHFSTSLVLAEHL